MEIGERDAQITPPEWPDATKLDSCILGIYMTMWRGDRVTGKHWDDVDAEKRGLDWIEQGLTSHQTHYRSYQGQVFMGQMTQPTVSKHWRKIGPKD